MTDPDPQPNVSLEETMHSIYIGKFDGLVDRIVESRHIKDMSTRNRHYKLLLEKLVLDYDRMKSRLSDDAETKKRKLAESDK